MSLARPALLLLVVVASVQRVAWAQDATLLPDIATEDELYEYWADGTIDDATLILLLDQFDAATRPTTGHGRLRLRTQGVLGDHHLPAMALQAEGRSGIRLDAGISLVVQRERPGRVAYDPMRDALTAKSPQPRIRVPKAYIATQRGAWQFLAGTYRIGFGQRLVLDNTGQTAPDGMRPDNGIIRGSELKLACREAAGERRDDPCAGTAGDLRMSPDYTWQSSLLGAAIGVRQPLDAGELVGYGFGSYQPISLSQYAILDAAQCVDPADQTDPACAAPEVYVRQADPWLETSTQASQVLPNVVNEGLGGAYLGYRNADHWRIGVTGWGAKPVWRPSGIALDFQPWARQPYGGGYGAVGAHAGWGSGRVDVGLELARSFDHMQGGGYGGIVRQKSNWADHMLEISLRWYGSDFANPYARPIAGADQRDGNRARDERGGRVTHTGSVGPIRMQALANVWQTLQERDLKFRTHWRGDLADVGSLLPGVWLAYRRDDYQHGNASACPVTAVAEATCSEDQVQVTPRLRIVPGGGGFLLFQYQHTWLDDPAVTGQKRQDAAVSVYATWQPQPWMVLRSRSKYVHQDRGNPARLPRYLHSFIAVAGDWMPDRGPMLSVEARYDHRLWLDRRESTLQRIPNPEHWLRLDMEVGF